MKLPRLLPVLALTLALCLALAACGGTLGDRDREAFLDIRAALLERESLDLLADLRADYGDRVYDYRLSYAGNAQEGTLSILEPVMLAGIQVKLEEGHTRIICGDLILDTGAIVREESPVQAYPLMLRAWLRGSVAECWHESYHGADCVAAEIHLGEAGAEGRLLCRVWFSRETLSPVYSELAKDGRVCLQCTFLSPEETA